jgi:hypothetical protein
MMLPHVAIALWFRSSVEKFMYGGLIFYALKRKQNVAAKCSNGTFELIATGDLEQKKLE